MTPDEFQKATGVSRETRDRLCLYVELLEKWQSRINLVGSKTLPDLWCRHVYDSAQLHALIPPRARCLLDFGSGAGFPGLVLAAMGGPAVHLVESDQRKAAFLREAARVAAIPVTVHACRIAALPPMTADVITARALAPLAQLLDFAEPFLAPEGICLFLKGQNVAAELTEAHKIWNMRVDRHPSQTDAGATVLALSEVRRDPTV
jgi:16S rRNA (guanine527-N7)-methyltransferase